MIGHKQSSTPHLFSSVCQEHSTIALWAAHLAASSLKRGEELAVDEGGLVALHARSDVTRHAKVRILETPHHELSHLGIFRAVHKKIHTKEKLLHLIDGTWNQTRHIGCAFERNGECLWEGGGCLHSREGALANVVGKSKSENSFCLKYECYYIKYSREDAVTLPVNKSPSSGFSRLWGTYAASN
jgi:hypothetical protein